MEAGIVGLPNVGKSTLFNALTCSGAAQSANYPFCTIEPNEGIVSVPDSRLGTITRYIPPQKVIPAILKLVDIAGIVEGASKSEGLGNKFLSHIREVDAILQVVRCFEDEDVTHVTGGVNPLTDIEVIETELLLADLETGTRDLAMANREALRQSTKQRFDVARTERQHRAEVEQIASEALESTRSEDFAQGTYDAFAEWVGRMSGLTTKGDEGDAISALTGRQIRILQGGERQFITASQRGAEGQAVAFNPAAVDSEREARDVLFLQLEIERLRMLAADRGEPVEDRMQGVINRAEGVGATQIEHLQQMAASGQFKDEETHRLLRDLIALLASRRLPTASSEAANRQAGRHREN